MLESVSGKGIVSSELNNRKAVASTDVRVPIWGLVLLGQ